MNVVVAIQCVSENSYNLDASLLFVSFFWHVQNVLFKEHYTNFLIEILTAIFDHFGYKIYPSRNGEW